MTYPSEPPGGSPTPEGGPAYVGASAVPGVPAGVQIADMGQRLLARIVDWIVVGVAVSILYLLFGGFPSVDPETGQQTGAGLGVQVVVSLLAVLYEVVLIAVRGQTIGKMALKIKVVREQDGQVPDWGPSILRWVVQLVGALVCGVGLIVVYLSPFFDKTGRRQGWHDKVAKTLVIKA